MSRRSRAPMPSSSATSERQVDDVAAVRARVRVVGLDHFAEQEHGAAVGVAQLQLGVDPHPAFPGEDGEQADQRQGEHAPRTASPRSRTRRRARPTRARRRWRRPRPSRAAASSAERRARPTRARPSWRSRTRTARGARPGRPATGRATAGLRRTGRARAPARRRATRSRHGGTRGRRAAGGAARPPSRRARSRPRLRAAPSRSAGRTASARGSAGWERPMPVPTSKSSRNEIAYAIEQDRDGAERRRPVAGNRERHDRAGREEREVRDEQRDALVRGELVQPARALLLDRALQLDVESRLVSLRCRGRSGHGQRIGRFEAPLDAEIARSLKRGIQSGSRHPKG